MTRAGGDGSEGGDPGGEVDGARVAKARLRDCSGEGGGRGPKSGPRGSARPVSGGPAPAARLRGLGSWLAWGLGSRGVGVRG